ncbi:sporulation protein YabP [Desulfotomaculum copahuensis]|uniref:Sporulation protein YabP n=1 Tax=Desulfotomaculum copahuensis TaxID=1838280 RepID=A0A1B7LCL8_9FIRM|nr:sporulation protein YabP [Desulfotomaculum copahuensis]OAT80680.1 sporulation protein YabP [Desulfotomaculum copahuensis]
MEPQGKNKVALTDRKHLQVEGVRQVESFDEKEITLDTNMGLLYLKGEGLHITQLDLGTGKLEAAGLFSLLQFREAKAGGRARGKGVLDRLLK